MSHAATWNEYEDVAPAKTASKHAVKHEVDEVLNQFSFGQMFWHNVKRYKFGLTMTWAIFVTIVWLFPFVPGLIWGFIQSLVG